MAVAIRKAVVGDAPRWLDLVTATLGADYPDKQVYNPVWIASQLAPGSDVETWVADDGTKLLASLSFLPPLPGNNNPVANVGRYMNRPGAYSDGSAAALIKHLGDLSVQR